LIFIHIIERVFPEQDFSFAGIEFQKGKPVGGFAGPALAADSQGVSLLMVKEISSMAFTWSTVLRRLPF